MDSLTTPQSSAIYVPSTVQNAAEWWTSLRPASHANPIPSPESASAPPITETYGPTRSESFAKWDQNTSSWKMFPALEPAKGSTSEALKRYGSSVYLTKTIVSRTQGESTVVTSRLMDSHSWEQLAGSFPTSAMMLNGILYLLPPLVPRTYGGDGGALPTPRTTDIRGQRILMRNEAGTIVRTNRAGTGKAGAQLSDMAAQAMWPTPNTTNRESHTSPSPGATERLSLHGMAKQGLWPTPDSYPRGGPVNVDSRKAGNHSVNLHDAVYSEQKQMWSTPKASAAHYGQPRDNSRGDLQAEVQNFPTPTAHLHDMGTMELARTSATQRKKQGIHYDPAVGGQLNPTWVEWLMGLPLEWTDLKPVETESFRLWLHSF